MDQGILQATESSEVSLNREILDVLYFVLNKFFTWFKEVVINKVRCLFKSECFFYKKAGERSRIFNFDQNDSSATIRVCGFAQCQDVYDFIYFDLCYFLSSGQLNPANKIFSNTEHALEIQLDTLTSVIPQIAISPSTSLPMIKFFKILKLLKTDYKISIDIKGISQDLAIYEEVKTE